MGLDIGTQSCCMRWTKKQRRKNRTIRLWRISFLRVQRGQVINIIQTVEAINHSIKQAKISSGVAIDTVGGRNSRTAYQ